MSPAPAWRQQELMLQRVAVALGPELLAQTAFVGGCTTALMVTDAVSREAVRFTDDVDLIVHVLGSRDIEDLLTVLDGRETLSAELVAADPELQQVIAGQLTALIAHPDFEYAVQSTARGNAQREELLFRRLEAIIALA